MNKCIYMYIMYNYIYTRGWDYIRIWKESKLQPLNNLCWWSSTSSWSLGNYPLYKIHAPASFSLYGLLSRLLSDCNLKWYMWSVLFPVAKAQRQSWDKLTCTQNNTSAHLYYVYTCPLLSLVLKLPKGTTDTDCCTKAATINQEIFVVEKFS